jgi:hypothetical protein
MLSRAYLLLLALAVLPACAMDLLPPKEVARNQAVSTGLTTQLSLDRSEVAPGGEFTATYSIRNSRAQPIRLESLCNSVARGVVYRDGGEVGFTGSGSGCRNAISTYEVASGATLEWKWTVTAAVILRAYPDGREPDVALAEAGQYVFRVEPDVYLIDRMAGKLPKMDQQIVVR